MQSFIKKATFVEKIKNFVKKKLLPKKSTFLSKKCQIKLGNKIVKKTNYLSKTIKMLSMKSKLWYKLYRPNFTNMFWEKNIFRHPVALFESFFLIG